MDIAAMNAINADVIYFVVEGVNARRIDSNMVEPLHAFGHTIEKMWLVDNHVEELKPEDDIPEGYIEKSEYGLVIYNAMKEEGGNNG